MSGDMQILRLPESPALETLRLSREAAPVPGPGEVALRVRASSLNYHDYLVVAGHIPQPAGRVPMSDGAGEILSLGAGVTGWSVGDGVMGAFFPNWLDGFPTEASNAAISGETINGFAAEVVVVPAASLTRIPRGWSFAEAATLPCAGLTAWRALRIEGQLEPGSTVLLPGSGGLSVYALQLAAALGLKAIMISSSDEKLERLATLGAAHGINYRRTPEWGPVARELNGGRGVDMVLEIGGQATFAQSVTACRMAGKVLVVGAITNRVPELPLRDVVMRHIKVGGMAVGSVAALRDLVDFVERHEIRPVIDSDFPLADLGAAFAYQLEGRHFGKITVSI